MKTFGSHKLSFVTVLVFFAAVVMTSCSKKDVRSDEPGFNPSEMEGAAAPVESGVGAGDVGAAATDLGIVYFAFDSYSLSNEARDALKANSEWMKNNPSSTVQIEGHCDERGTVEYNLALGERRANAAKDYLVKSGVDAARVSIISYGEERPQDPGHDEAAWAKNRRAAFVMLSQ